MLWLLMWAVPATASAAFRWASPVLIDSAVQHVQTLLGTGTLDDVSCPSTTLCVAVDNDGNVVTSRNPTGGPSAWTVSPVAGSVSIPFYSVSCPSTSLCVASGAAEIFASNDPAAGGSTWSLRSAGTGATYLACPTTSECVGVIGEDVVTSTDPSSPASTWTSAQLDDDQVPSCASESDVPCPASLTGISCPSASFCAAVDEDGYVFTSSNPTGGPAAWASRRVDTAASGGIYGFNGISCSSVSLCVAIDYYQGQVFTSKHPSGEASAWTASSLPGTTFGGASFAIGCALVSQCVVVDDGGGAEVSENPTGGKSAWSATNIDGVGEQPPRTLNAVSCPSAYLCAAVDSLGYAVVGTWTPTAAQVKAQLRTLSAPGGESG